MPRCSRQLRGGGASYQRVLRRSSCSWQRSKVHARARVRLRSPAACLRAARALSLHTSTLIHTSGRITVTHVVGATPAKVGAFPSTLCAGNLSSTARQRCRRHLSLEVFLQSSGQGAPRWRASWPRCWNNLNKITFSRWSSSSAILYMLVLGCVLPPLARQGTGDFLR